MPGGITWGLGEGDGLGLPTLLVGARLGRVAVLFFRGALFAFGLLAGFIFDMSCPSCCGNTLVVSANIKASALSVRSAILKLPDQFMVPPKLVARANSDMFQTTTKLIGDNTGGRPRHHHECDVGRD